MADNNTNPTQSGNSQPLSSSSSNGPAPAAASPPPPFHGSEAEWHQHFLANNQVSSAPLTAEEDRILTEGNEQDDREWAGEDAMESEWEEEEESEEEEDEDVDDTETERGDSSGEEDEGEDEA